MIINVKNKYVNKKIDINDINSYNSFLNKNHNLSAKKYKYNSEIILVTNCRNLKNTLLFLYWHLYIIKFDHIIIFDNSDNNILKPYIKLFDNKITYIIKPGIIEQSACYNQCIQNSNARWVLPIDDDEFLYISEKYNHDINCFINHITNKQHAYKYAFNWRLFNSPEDIIESNDFYINMFQYMFYLKGSLYKLPENVDGMNLIKTLIDTSADHLYLSDNNKRKTINLSILNTDEYKSYINNRMDDGSPVGTVHNPITIINDTFYHAYNTEYNQYCVDLFYDDNLINSKSDVYLAHYRYKTIKENEDKQKNFKLCDISFKFQKEHYNNTAINTAVNCIRKYLIFNDDLYQLLQKYIDTEKFKLIFSNI